ncbi:MAG: fumarylacetoacetate hydrolase family protein [Bacteroidia bacterium]|nr:fumarylacetoacetate hydrolase family protein [Bacteroidia bacterium]
MKLVTYKQNNNAKLGIYVNDNIYDLADAADKAGNQLPDNMKEFLKQGESAMNIAREIEDKLKSNSIDANKISYSEDVLESPVNEPASCRDAYAFRQHVASARRNRGVDMIPEFDQFPIFYFTNHNSVQGPGDIMCMPDHFHRLDFELEVAIVVGKEGINITADEADDYIAGYMVYNDMSARRMQMEEMKLNLGPAKGKDFANAFGPWLVTKDELDSFKKGPKPGHTGNNYDLNMKCWVNGKQVSEGNVADMDWTFAEILQRCAYGTKINPGDVIGSGTVGTGCFLELNGTAKRNNPDATPQWLNDGDVVEMEIQGLGRLKNTIKAHSSDMSLFALKKNLEGESA